MEKEPERKDDVDKAIDDLEVHSLKDELPSDETAADTDTCGTCTCPCDA